MKSLTEYIAEGRENYADELNVKWNKKNVTYGVLSPTARPFIYDKKTKSVEFGLPRDTHQDLLDNLPSSVIKKFRLPETPTLLDIRFIYKSANKALYDKWIETHKDAAENIRSGRIWDIKENKYHKGSVFVGWWEELSTDEFNEMNDAVIASFNDKIYEYFAMDNNGHLVAMVRKDDKSWVEVDARSKEYAEQNELKGKLHADPAYREIKKKDTETWREMIASLNVEKENKTKSKSMAEYNFFKNMYRDNLNSVQKPIE